MRDKKKMITCGMAAGFILAGTVISAAGAELRGPSDCTASLNLERTSGTYSVYESSLPPNTAKSINGQYSSRDINWNIQNQSVSRSIGSGQISVTKYAPTHYQSYKGWMDYFLDGRHAGTIEKEY